MSSLQTLDTQTLEQSLFEPNADQEAILAILKKRYTEEYRPFYVDGDEQALELAVQDRVYQLGIDAALPLTFYEQGVIAESAMRKAWLERHGNSAVPLYLIEACYKQAP